MRSIIPLILTIFMCVSCGKSRHTIFIVDTSGSMQEKNLMQDVKNSIKEILLDYKKGDSVSIVTFDTEPRIAYTGLIESNTDLKDVFSEVDGFSASGKWTCLVKVMDHSLNFVQNLLQKGKEKNISIVLYTDGKNDPPPYEGKDPELDFSKLITKYYRNYVSSKDWYIYYVQLDEPDRDLEKFLADTGSGEIVNKNDFKNNLNVMSKISALKKYKWLLIPILLLPVLLIFLFWNRFLHTELVPMERKTEIPDRQHSIGLGRYKKAFRNVLVLGGGSSSDINLNVSGIAEKHAYMEADIRGRYFISPVSKDSAVYVDGHEITQKTAIKPGQTISMGGVKFLFNKGGK